MAAHLTMQPGQIITQAEAARIRGLSRQRINQLVNQGKIRSTKVGNQIMVLKTDVENVQVRMYKKKSEYWTVSSPVKFTVQK